MMRTAAFKSIVSAFALTLTYIVPIQLSVAQTPAETAAEEARRLGETFAGGFFNMEPERAISVLHPALSKLGVIPNARNSGMSTILRLTPGTLRAFSRSHNADGHIDLETAEIEINILDVDPSGRVALFNLVADKGWFDYYLAAKVGERWYLVNCVFGVNLQLVSETPDEDRQAVMDAARAYAEGIAQGDFEKVKSAIHLDFERRSIKPLGAGEYVAPETLETLRYDLGRAERQTTPGIEFLGVTQVTGAVRIDAEERTEWVMLLKMDGVWTPVNSLWIPL